MSAFVFRNSLYSWGDATNIVLAFTSSGCHVHQIPSFWVIQMVFCINQIAWRFTSFATNIPSFENKYLLIQMSIQHLCCIGSTKKTQEEAFQSGSPNNQITSTTLSSSLDTRGRLALSKLLFDKKLFLQQVNLALRSTPKVSDRLWG